MISLLQLLLSNKLAYIQESKHICKYESTYRNTKPRRPQNNVFFFYFNRVNIVSRRCTLFGKWNGRDLMDENRFYWNT